MSEQGRAAKFLPCPKCGKRAYANEAEAMRAVGEVLRTRSRIMQPYFGPCGRWHLTSQPLTKRDKP